MPVFITSEDVRAPTPEVSLPLHASVSAVSAACAVGNPTSITARAMTHEQRRSIGYLRSRYLDATPRLIGLIRAQAALPRRIWCRNPQRQTVTRPKDRHFQ